MTACTGSIKKLKGTMQQRLSIPPSLQMILAFTGCPAALDATSISANHSSLVGPRSRIFLWQKCRSNKIVFKQLKFKGLRLGGIDLCHVFSCATCRILSYPQDSRESWNPDGCHYGWPTKQGAGTRKIGYRPSSNIFYDGLVIVSPFTSFSSKRSTLA